MCNTYSNTYQHFCIKYLIQCVNASEIKVAISEFGLWMLILILLNHYIFVEVMRYLHDNKWFGSQKMHLKTHFFNYIVLHCIVFYDINLTISPLDRLGYNSKINVNILHQDLCLWKYD